MTFPSPPKSLRGTQGPGRPPRLTPDRRPASPGRLPAFRLSSLFSGGSLTCQASRARTWPSRLVLGTGSGRGRLQIKALDQNRGAGPGSGGTTTPGPPPRPVSPSPLARTWKRGPGDVCSPSSCGEGLDGAQYKPKDFSKEQNHVHDFYEGLCPHSNPSTSTASPTTPRRASGTQQGKVLAPVGPQGPRHLDPSFTKSTFLAVKKRQRGQVGPQPPGALVGNELPSQPPSEFQGKTKG